MRTVRCRLYKSCDYKKKCSHAIDHYVNNPTANKNKCIVSKIAEACGCYCSELYSEISHRKEKLEKIKKATE